jgi:hypothetical protein
MLELKENMSRQQEFFKDKLDKLYEQQQNDHAKKEHADAEIREIREQLLQHESIAKMKADRIYQMANTSIKKVQGLNDDQPRESRIDPSPADILSKYDYNKNSLQP